MKDREKKKRGILKKLLMARVAWTAVGVPIVLYRCRNEDSYSWRPFIEMGIAIVPEIVAALAIQAIIRDWREDPRRS